VPQNLLARRKNDDGGCMITSEIVQAVENIVREKLKGDSSGHDFWHIQRVRKTAFLLASTERADAFVVELAALLHDISDWKFNNGDDTVGPRLAGEILTSLEVSTATIDHVVRIIATTSFKGANVPDEMDSLEGRCVQDADRLDAIGAVGIARTFAFGGHANRAIFDPEVPAEQHDTKEAYYHNQSSTINHFHEKLLLLRDRMKTPTGRRLADSRHRFMEQFLERFMNEWEGRL
jgi:uncharacterized protein